MMNESLGRVKQFLPMMGALKNPSKLDFGMVEISQVFFFKVFIPKMCPGK